MGVPALFRWLSKKYPKIISPVIEEETQMIDGVEYPGKYENPNPNGELDNLYLDMNGIVHPCSHPENKPPPETEEEMMVDIFRYTDRVLNMARPRKILMIAVDGVAPRAKMNQQRARRFRAAQDAKIQNEERERQVQEMELRGEVIEDVIKGRKKWDSNAITPGTPFMDVLAESLRFWVSYKLSNDPGWANLQVVISDATVPGEGEHKIMNFIRSQRTDPEHDPNTSHCIYGLDADLIFLSLASHEPHFKVLREDVFAQDNRAMRLKDQMHISELDKLAIQEMDSKKPFLWLHTHILREYLEVELNIPNLRFPFDLERAIDDWVFMCFFVGNDFLPHLPSLDVRDNGIDILVNIWKRLLPQLKSYITCDGNINLKAVEKLLEGLAMQEDGIFRRRQERENRYLENQKRRQTESVGTDFSKVRRVMPASKIQDNLTNAQVYSTTTGKNVTEGLKLNHRQMAQLNNEITMAGLDGKSVAEVITKKSEALAADSKDDESDSYDPEAALAIEVGEKDDADSEYEPEKTVPLDLQKNDSNISAAAALKLKLLAGAGKSASGSVSGSNVDNVDSSVDSNVDSAVDSSSTDAGQKRKLESTFVAESLDANGDTIKMYEPGYRQRYYEQKFHCQTEEEMRAKRKDVVKSYIEGVCWVLLYYYQGCPSWNWYYPYHYAPFAKDFDDLSGIEVKFQLGKPFRPYEQLMSVMPLASGHTLPDVFTPLMKDPDSEIIDFYPEEFEIDMNGKKMSWQGIPLLPFIDEKRLLKLVQAKYPLLTELETERNTLKQDVLLVGRLNKNFDKFKSAIYEEKVDEVFFKSRKTGLAGRVFQHAKFDINGVTRFHLNQGDYTDVDNKSILVMGYQMPPKKTPGKSMLLTGFVPHLKMLTQEDKDSLIYGRGGANYRYRNPKFDGGSKETDFKKNIGPFGESMYTLRVGGYKGWTQVFAQQLQLQQQPQQYVQNEGYGYQNNGYQNNGYQNNGYQNHGHQNNSYQNHGHQNNGYQNNRYQNNGYQNNGHQNGYQNHNSGYQNNRYGNNNHNRNNYNNGNQGYRNNHNSGWNNSNGGNGRYRGNSRY